MSFFSLHPSFSTSSLLSPLPLPKHYLSYPCPSCFSLVSTPGYWHARDERCNISIPQPPRQTERERKKFCGGCSLGNFICISVCFLLSHKLLIFPPFFFLSFLSVCSFVCLYRRVSVCTVVLFLLLSCETFLSFLLCRYLLNFLFFFSCLGVFSYLIASLCIFRLVWRIWSVSWVYWY